MAHPRHSDHGTHAAIGQRAAIGHPARTARRSKAALREGGTGTADRAAARGAHLRRRARQARATSRATRAWASGRSASAAVGWTSVRRPPLGAAGDGLPAIIDACGAAQSAVRRAALPVRITDLPRAAAAAHRPAASVGHGAACHSVTRNRRTTVSRRITHLWRAAIWRARDHLVAPVVHGHAAPTSTRVRVR